MLYQFSVNTPLGEMIAIADDNKLYLLEFSDCKNLRQEIVALKVTRKSELIEGESTITKLLDRQMADYFRGNLKNFSIPLDFTGTNFQKLVWQSLISIPYGSKISYSQQADGLNKPLSYRAVANGNAANKIAIIVPCHRVINQNGKLGGYKSGLDRKDWLIKHEMKHSIT